MINKYIRSFANGALDAEVNCTHPDGRLTVSSSSECLFVIRALNAAVDDQQDAKFTECDDATRPVVTENTEALEISFPFDCNREDDKSYIFSFVSSINNAITTSSPSAEVSSIDFKCHVAQRRRSGDTITFTVYFESEGDADTTASALTSVGGVNATLSDGTIVTSSQIESVTVTTTLTTTATSSQTTSPSTSLTSSPTSSLTTTATSSSTSSVTTSQTSTSTTSPTSTATSE